MWDRQSDIINDASEPLEHRKVVVVRQPRTLDGSLEFQCLKPYWAAIGASGHGQVGP